MEFKNKRKTKITTKNGSPFDMYKDYFFKREKDKNPRLYENQRFDKREFEEKRIPLSFLGTQRCC